MNSSPQKASGTATTTTGSVEDVAAFFGVSVRTVQNWRAANPPVIGSWQEGRNIRFGEDDVVKLWVERHIERAGYKPGEALEIARRQWHDHLQVRQADAELRARVHELSDQLLALSARLVILEETRRGDFAMA